MGVEDTFFRFMDKMVRQYMREEELRTRHQSNLLDLRERALQERTQAELEWLRLKKKQIRSKGADDLMPPLVRREKGLLMRLEEEQVQTSPSCSQSHSLFMCQYSFLLCRLRFASCKRFRKLLATSVN